MGGAEAIAQSHKQFGKDHEFLYKNREKWRELYPNCWVAVFKEELIAVEKDFLNLPEIIKRKNIPRPYSPVISYLSTEQKIWILSLR